MSSYHFLQTAKDQAFSEYQNIENIFEGILTNPNPEFERELVEDMGLSDLVPYLSDLSQVIREGKKWQGILGTKKALLVALGWLDISPVEIRLNGPGVHFSEYEIYLDQEPNQETITKIIGLMELSAPARCELVRLVHKNADFRPIVPSSGRNSKIGSCLIAAYSGKNIQNIKISFPKKKDHNNASTSNS